MLKIQKEGLTENIIKHNALEACEEIYKQLNISEMSVINMGGAGDSGNAMAKAIAQYQQVSKVMKDDD